MVARFTNCCLSYILHTILYCPIFYTLSPSSMASNNHQEKLQISKIIQYIINSNHKSMQLELLYDQTPSCFLDDFRKLVQSHPEVQLAAVQDCHAMDGPPPQMVLLDCLWLLYLVPLCHNRSPLLYFLMRARMSTKRHPRIHLCT